MPNDPLMIRCSQKTAGNQCDIRSIFAACLVIDINWGKVRNDGLRPFRRYLKRGESTSAHSTAETPNQTLQHKRSGNRSSSCESAAGAAMTSVGQL